MRSRLTPADMAAARAAYLPSLETPSPVDSETAILASAEAAAEARRAAARKTLERPAPRQAPKGEARRLVSRRLSRVTMRAVQWYWPGRIARGKHTTLAGEPGVGKSTLLYWVAATITRGGAWPCGEGRAPLGSVVLLSAEDGAEDTIAPRIAAAGGDLSKVHVVTAATDSAGRVSSFTLGDDLEALEKLILEIGDVALVIVDPITSYLGAADGHSNTDIRRVVEPLHELADRLGVAVLSNSHFAKSSAKDKARASHRVIGSTAFIALPRVALSVVQDPDDDERRLVLHLKNNLAPPAAGLAFRLEQKLAAYVGEPPEPLFASVATWEPEPVTVTADEAIAQHEEKLRGEAASRRKGGPSPEQAEAEEFLRDQLADGPKAKQEIEKEARAAGISVKTLKVVRQRTCSVELQKDDKGRVAGAIWTLKPDPSAVHRPCAPYGSAE